jgi:hypothetical protein
VKVVTTWIDAVRMGEVGAEDRLVVAVAQLSRPLQELAEALDRRRRPHPGASSPGEQRQLDRFRALLRERDVSDAVEADAIMDRAALLVIDAVEDASPHSRSPERCLRAPLSMLAMASVPLGSSAPKYAAMRGSGPAISLAAGSRRYAAVESVWSKTRMAPRRPPRGR